MHSSLSGALVWPAASGRASGAREDHFLLHFVVRKAHNTKLRYECSPRIRLSHGQPVYDNRICAPSQMLSRNRTTYTHSSPRVTQSSF